MLFNTFQFNAAMEMIARAVTAYEADVRRKDEEWASVKEELTRRREVMEKLRTSLPELLQDGDGFDIVSLKDLLEGEDHDADSSD